MSCFKRPICKFKSNLNSALQLAFLFGVLAAGGCGGHYNPVPPILVSVTISPTSGQIAVSATQQFSVVVAGTPNQRVNWVASAGSISKSGLYTAPAIIPNPATVTITATSIQDIRVAAAATMTVVPGPNSITISLSPSAGSVKAFGTLQYTATVTGDANTAVTWYVNGVQGGSQASGYVSSSGLYYAPSGVPTTSNGNGSTQATTAAVRAVLNDNTSYYATANVTIQPANQSVQTTPIELGTSGGNLNDSSIDKGVPPLCCGGTLGALITLDNKQYILSTNHALARSGAANIGDSIVQPSLLDTNCDTARATPVATLSQFYSLTSQQLPNIDAAIAQVIAGQVDPSGNILYLGSTTDANNVPVAGAPYSGGVLPPSSTLIGVGVAKSGRTTGLTCSTVDSIQTALSVEYVQNCDGTGIPNYVQFTGQIDIEGTAFSALGDSGALVVSQDNAIPVGLLFAATDTSSVANPIQSVLNYFQDAKGNVPTIVGGAEHQVIGCTLPAVPQSAQSLASAATATNAALASALKTRDAHLSEILSHAGVEATGVGTSHDNPSDAAIVVYVAKDQPYTNLPQEIDGVRTRIVEMATPAQYGGLSVAESAKLEQSVASVPAAPRLSESEFERAQVVHSANVTSLLKQSGVQGVGISASLDSPGEAALMIFLVRGVAHDPIPAVIGGVRTRVKESNRFRASYGGTHSNSSCRVPTKKTGLALAPKQK